MGKLSKRIFISSLTIAFHHYRFSPELMTELVTLYGNRLVTA